ncbi:MAG: ArgE/DapE family deacylase [candidate division KSB1 bacterium]|nr:ArgE/DapE family deacylase [candidate division KSB1 bacterium]MDZ7276241.1 ArgE/DapE family deacylase [candidate division KSB1 bacterium]MDZ7287953.1 ArgE/DapE family deacylase [candidate division KSB1 bacterium]MDZ7300034.1 ArgE/DapE family deacylase [candidate division KSB1 bacterium]MDZ7308424.1 ArgE/DapE family deacylase [candidate division KSB1 bacterium]
MHRAIAIARDLIAIPSVNPMGKNLRGEIYSEKQVAAYVAQFLSALGVAVEVEAPDPEHPNVIARIDAGRRETLLLEAHMDTVSHENMSIAPFDPKIENGLLFGRGSCDTKSGLAVYLYAIERMLQAGHAWARNLILAAVHDEEFSFSGAKQLARRGIAATFAIASEPTSLQVIHAHKGVCRFLLVTHGRSAHAALPWLGESAIYKMGEVIRRLEDYSRRLGGSVHPELGPATVNLGRIWGGETVNTVPATCTMEIDHRLLPGDDYDTIRAGIEQALQGMTGYDIAPPYLQVPGMYVAKNSPACRSLVQACHAAGWKPQVQTAHYATDASILCGAGIPTLVFGPGDIAQAHTAAEHIRLGEIELAGEIILALLRA